MRVPSDPPFSRSVAQSLERAAWDREVAGGNPAVPTIFKLLSWPNTSGIRLLSGFMQVKILSAAPLPGGVKVARRPVKPFGVGASPTLAAISGCNVSSRRPCSERGGRRCNSCHPDHFWKAGRYKLAAPVPKTGSASPRSEHYRRLPPSSRSSKAEHPADNRKTQERYLPGRPAAPPAR